MPQVAKAIRGPLDSGKMIPQDVGDICYLFTTKIILPLWREHPKWATVSKLRRMLVLSPDLVKLRGIVRGCPFEDAELLNQAALAFEEFYRRCGGNYENEKARVNTDVYYGIPFAKSAQLLQGE